MSVPESDIESLLRDSISSETCGGVLTQDRIDTLDQVLASIDPGSVLYARTLPTFRAICRRSGCLPSSCYLAEEVVLESPHPLHQTALSDVYQGHIGSLRVALKSLRLHSDNRSKTEKSFYGEVMAWRCLRHPNITPFLGVSTIFPVCLVSKWMTNGNIADFLRMRPNENRLKYARDILEGLQYMHSLGIVHGGLKTVNVLVDENFNASLTDFGLVSLLQVNHTVTDTSYLGGTVRWMAPEILQGGRPTFASDIYSVAVVVWELFTGRLPFDELASGPRVIIEVLAGRQLPKPTDATRFGCTPALWSAMQQSWSIVASQRPKCRQLLSIVVSLDGLNQVASLDVDMTCQTLIRTCYGDLTPSSSTSVLTRLGLLLWKVTVTKWSINPPHPLATLESLGPIRQVLASISTFGLDEHIDLMCQARLLICPSAGYTPGIIPSNTHEGWTISPVVSAIRLLVIVAILQKWVSLDEHAIAAQEVLYFYLNSLPKAIGSAYQSPCLAFLADCCTETSENWWIGNARKAAITTFHTELAKMSHNDLVDLTQQWHKQLPSLHSPATASSLPAITPFTICTYAALHVYKAVPPEVLGKLAAFVLHHLQIQSPAHCSLAIDLSWRGEEATSPTWNNRKQARRAILEVAKRSPRAFMRSLVAEVESLHITTTSKLESLVRFLARKVPDVIFWKLPDLTEAAINAIAASWRINPAETNLSLREMICALYRSSPTIDIHAPSQRLVIGIPNGAVIVYDLRRARSIVVLDAHQGVPTCCSFSPSGKWLITVSIEESMIHVWQVPPMVLSSGTRAQIHKSGYFDGTSLANITLTEMLRTIRVKWPSDAVETIKIQDSVLTISIQ